MVKKASFILAVIILAVTAGFALLHPGLIPTHDGEYHVVRFYEFNKALLSGDLYPRWAMDLNSGYGVPLFNFVYPLPNYFSSLIHLFGFSFIDAFKLQMFLSLIIGGIFFYLWSKEFWGNLGGLVSSAFYIFSPYHFVDIYIRGSIGEVLALAIFPAFLWSITKYIKTKNKIFFPLSSLLLALTIFSHNILALMFFGFSIFYISLLIYMKKNKNEVINVIKIFALGLLMSSIFWLPALLETKLTVGLQVYDIESNFPLLYQLLIPSWGSGFSSEDLGSQISFQIGLANLFIVLLLIAYLILRRKWEDKKTIAIFFIFWFCLIFFLMLRESTFIWKAIPLMNYFQFPWRFLSLEIIIASFLSGAVVYFFRAKIFVTVFLIFITVSLGIGYSTPAYYMYRNDDYYIKKENFIDGTNSPGNSFNTLWFNTSLKKTNQRLFFSKGSGQIKNLLSKNFEYIFEVDAKDNAELTANIAYFPRWSVYVDDKQIKVKGTDSGLFSFVIDKGSHLVKVKFENTYARRLGELGFWLSTVIMLALFVKAISDRIKR